MTFKMLVGTSHVVLCHLSTRWKMTSLSLTLLDPWSAAAPGGGEVGPQEDPRGQDRRHQTHSQHNLRHQVPEYHG